MPIGSSSPTPRPSDETSFSDSFPHARAGNDLGHRAFGGCRLPTVESDCCLASFCTGERAPADRACSPGSRGVSSPGQCHPTGPSSGSDDQESGGALLQRAGAGPLQLSGLGSEKMPFLDSARPERTATGFESISGSSQREVRLGEWSQLVPPPAAAVTELSLGFRAHGAILAAA